MKLRDSCILLCAVISSAAHADNNDKDTIQLGEIQVLAPQEDYVVHQASTATKGDADLQTTPVSVQVVPKAILEDQQVTDLGDVYRNVSGVQPDYGFSNWNSAFMRGFSNMEGNQNAATYRNGVREFGRGGGLEEMSNVEQVEIVKGPASVLYGRIEPGGLINVITKQPEATPYYSLQQQIGSYDFYRTTMDATGPVDKDGKLLYRFDAAVQTAGSFRNVMFSDYVFVAPSFTLRPNEDLTINVDLESRYARGPGDYGIPALIPGVSKKLWIGDTTDNAWLDKNRESIDWTYNLNDNWKIKNGLSVFQGDTRYQNLYEVAGSFNAATGDLQLSPWVGTNKVHSKSALLELSGNEEFASMKHGLLFGADYERSNTSLTYYTDGFGALYNFNVFNPVYGFANYALLNSLAPDFLQSWTEDWKGIYAQDQITIAEKWHVLVGGRYDWTETTAAGTFVSATQPSTTYSGFKPRLGVLYQTTPSISLYGSYTESLGSLNPGVAASGDTFKPEQAKQYETGVKFAKPDGSLMATVAIYQIEKTNVISPDPSNSLPIFQVASGEARSRGLEFDSSGKLTDHVDFTANYAYTNVVINKDSNGYQGKTFADVAKNTANLWLRYSPVQNLKFGAGVYLVGDRYGDPLNTFKLPGYARLDMMASYKIKQGNYPITAQLNINNVLDKDYLANTVRIDNTPRENIITGTPLSAIASIKIEL